MPQPMPEEDSRDLSDDDIGRAIQTGGLDDIVSIIGPLRGLACRVCGLGFQEVGHELRRRAPHLYWRVTSKCRSGHPVSTVFQTDWVRP